MTSPQRAVAAMLLLSTALTGCASTGTEPSVAPVPATVSAGWSGLTPGTRYLGVVDFDSGAGTIGSTIVAVRG